MSQAAGLQWGPSRDSALSSSSTAALQHCSTAALQHCSTAARQVQGEASIAKVAGKWASAEAAKAGLSPKDRVDCVVKAAQARRMGQDSECTNVGT